MARAPEAILPYSYAGTMGLVQGESIAARFFNVLGASRLDRTICAAAGAAGLRYTYGGSLGMHTKYFEESELILIWGSNSIASNLHFWTRAQEAKRRGTKICGIEAQVVIDFARAFGSTKKALIRLNYGMQRVRGGGNAVHAIACLPSLTGAWRERSGGLLLSSSNWAPVDVNALERPDLLPGWPSTLPRIVNMNAIGDALLHPGDASFGQKVEALIVYNSNPVAVAPDSVKVAAGFAREDRFTIMLEHFQTDTADYADLILPATT